LTSQADVQRRREAISRCLAKSITSPSLIAKQTNLELSQVKNDLVWMRKNAKTWLTGHALDGYVFETKNTIDQLKDIEVELQKMRTEAPNTDEKIKIIHELKDTINMRWVIQGDGPTLMAQRYADMHGNETP